MSVSLAHGQDSETDGTLPDIGMLPCAGACATATQPNAVSKGRIDFPRPLLDQLDGVEALVTLRYTIEADGTVGEVTAVQQMGPDGFVRAAKAGVRRWTFKPATSGGKPVATSRRVNVVFNVAHLPPGARTQIVSAYRQAVDLIKMEKLDDASVVLNQAQSLERLNLYERGMLAYLQASIAVQRRDYMEARRLATVTTLYGSKLPPDILRSLLRIRITAGLQLGDVADAIRSLEELRDVKGFNPSDPAIALVADYRKTVDAAAAFTAEGKMPPAGGGDVFVFELYRRDFTIRKISGALQKFTIACRQGVSESPISDNAEWHIPRNWNSCQLYFQGAPGTTFQIVQFAPAPAGGSATTGGATAGGTRPSQ